MVRGSFFLRGVEGDLEGNLEKDLEKMGIVMGMPGWFIPKFYEQHYVGGCE